MERRENPMINMDKNLYFQYYFWRDTLSKIISRIQLTSHSKSLTIGPRGPDAEDETPSLEFTLKDSRTGNFWQGPFNLLVHHSGDFYPCLSWDFRASPCL